VDSLIELAASTKITGSDDSNTMSVDAKVPSVFLDSSHIIAGAIVTVTGSDLANNAGLGVGDNSDSLSMALPAASAVSSICGNINSNNPKLRARKTAVEISSSSLSLQPEAERAPGSSDLAASSLFLAGSEPIPRGWSGLGASFQAGPEPGPQGSSDLAAADSSFLTILTAQKSIRLVQTAQSMKIWWILLRCPTHWILKSHPCPFLVC
jgi:hypothetical protein